MADARALRRLFKAALLASGRLAVPTVLVWIVVQLAFIGYVSWMQPATLVGGVVVLVLAWLLPPSSARTNGL
jgi:hypothetical protein